jgi:hypothetical protein
MAHTIRGRVQSVLLLAWALVVILIGLLSSTGGEEDPSPEAVSLLTHSREDGKGEANPARQVLSPVTALQEGRPVNNEIPENNMHKEGNTHYGE